MDQSSQLRMNFSGSDNERQSELHGWERAEVAWREIGDGLISLVSAGWLPHWESSSEDSRSTDVRELAAKRTCTRVGREFLFNRSRRRHRQLVVLLDDRDAKVL